MCVGVCIFVYVTCREIDVWFGSFSGFFGCCCFGWVNEDVSGTYSLPRGSEAKRNLMQTLTIHNERSILFRRIRLGLFGLGHLDRAIRGQCRAKNKMQKSKEIIENRQKAEITSASRKIKCPCRHMGYIYELYPCRYVGYITILSPTPRFIQKVII